MQKELAQKTKFESVNYTIADSGLLKKTVKRLGGDSEFHFPFEQITTNRASVLDHNKIVLLMASLFALISLILFIARFSDKTIPGSSAPIWLVISFIFFVIYFTTKSFKLYLETTTTKIIEFHYNKPTKEKVNEFIDNLISERNSYLLLKYGQITKNLEYAPQMDNLNWLLNNRVLSKLQYEEKLKELNTLFNTTSNNKPIGFSTNK